MEIITTLRNRLECKINFTLPALLSNKFNMTTQGLATSSENIRSKRAIPALAIIQGIAAIGGMMIKGVNPLVDAKRASSFNNSIKLVTENVQITHDRLITLENRTVMMAKAIIPVLKDFEEKINSTNKRLTRQYRMMIRAHDRYNTLFRQTSKTFQIHHLALLMFKDYMSCISKTACFLVNCAPLSLQFGWNEEPKGLNGSRPSECDYRTPPSKLDTAPFWCAKPQPIRGFPAIEPVTFQCRQ